MPSCDENMDPIGLGAAHTCLSCYAVCLIFFQMFFEFLYLLIITTYYFSNNPFNNIVGLVIHRDDKIDLLSNDFIKLRLKQNIKRM